MPSSRSRCCVSIMYWYTIFVYAFIIIVIKSCLGKHETSHTSHSPNTIFSIFFYLNPIHPSVIIIIIIIKGHSLRRACLQYHIHIISSISIPCFVIIGWRHDMLNVPPLAPRHRESGVLLWLPSVQDHPPSVLQPGKRDKVKAVYTARAGGAAGSWLWRLELHRLPVPQLC